MKNKILEVATRQTLFDLSRLQICDDLRRSLTAQPTLALEANALSVDDDGVRLVTVEKTGKPHRRQTLVPFPANVTRESLFLALACDDGRRALIFLENMRHATGQSRIEKKARKLREAAIGALRYLMEPDPSLETNAAPAGQMH